MYGWIVEGISSLFEPLTGERPASLTGERPASLTGERPASLTGERPASLTRERPASLTREIPTPAEEELQRQDSQARPAKRNYQSVHAADSVVQNEQVEVKRRKRDVVLSFVKKTVAGIAGLLKLQSERPRPHAEIQTHPVTLMGIDELNTSWMSSFDWRMDKPGGGGLGERANGGMNVLQGSSPPLMKKQTRVPERGKYGEDPRRRSLQLLPSRHTGGLGAGPPGLDLAFPGPAPNRGLRSCLAVEQALKESDRERYRRLVEMVSEKYSKTQPLPFNRTKPAGVSLPQDGHRAAVVGRTCDSTPRMTAPPRASPGAFTWRDGSSAKQTRDRWGEVCLSKSLTGSVDTQPVSGATKRQVAEVDLSAEVAARLHLVDRETPAPPQTHTDTHTTHAANTHTTHATNTHTTHATNIRHSDKDIPRLTKDMAAEVSRALAQSDPSLVLSSAFKLRITQRDLATLQESSWLNDEVINFYLSLVMARSSGQGAGLRVYSFSTFFFPKLRGGYLEAGPAGGHATVRRWTKAVDIFLHDILLVPLHLGVHWSLAVVDFKSRSVMSYDSMGQRHEDMCSMLLLYLKEEHRVRKGREMDVSKWLTGSMSAREIPQQKNGSDCGVFSCKYADYIAQGRPLTFRQCHMPLFRKLMMWEILNQRLL